MLMRRMLIASSQNQWLAQRAPRYRFVRKAVQRFMPGEDVEDALRAAGGLQEKRISALLTQLGENVKDLTQADAVTRHYLEVMDKVAAQKLGASISVKPTQLGFDQNRDACLANTERLVQRAEQLGNFVWIDMEASPYVDGTLDLYRKLRARHRDVGLAMQSYLYRTEKDIDELLAIAPAIRLVKGAYNEPPQIAYPKKKDVDDAYWRLAQRLLAPEAIKAGTRPAFGTHDPKLIQKVEQLAAQHGYAKESVEFQLLYGIQRAEQVRLAQAGYRVRVLISYGSEWFPWYMRRLAERPANLGFVLRNLFSS